MPADLANRDDVERLVVAFYETAFRDPIIGPIFTDVAHMDLAAHLPVMCDFWETVLFRSGAYRRNALQVHVALHERHPLTDADFTRWLQLWTATVDRHFAGPVAQRAKLQAARIAASMERRLAGGSGSAFETVGRRDD
ncbi:MULTISPECIES: group III truncated hemoglobin [unclassified Agromyces]|uniref:group III truncated hemoglobin n=1 Tax=unclassified Agromyces TaxID=2639701 RepID=UPI003014DFC3